ncbi:AMP-binding protein [Sphingopyxis sp. GW247-27LB]|uniref:AMP-binding protein n=1 Tax=Sphingopyxis sp. GW247-27LB TaxID=2012632 RepID=UPI000BA772C1|nr:AMP-binding protein [Sphingopyxis sp. GW247-27LB]PAL24215.1 acyl-CoA synthetase [Sphingopyxis sp. GW247-27LB]
MSQHLINVTSTGTLGQIAIDAIARYPDRPMISDGKTIWTYRDLGHAIGRYMTALRGMGVERGEGIAVLSANRVEPWALLCAANLMGIRYTPMHPMAAEDDHVHIVEDSGATTLVIDADKFAERGVAIRNRVESLDRLVSLGECDQAIDLLAAATDVEPLPLEDHAQSEETAYLVYTGGTTGRSKGVMLSHRSLVTMSTVIASEWEWPATPRYAIVTPISHAGGINLYPIMFLGGYARLLQGWDTEQFCATVAEDRLNCAFLVPTIINNLIDASEVRARHDLSSIELLIYGAAPMSPDRLRQGIAIFGQVFLQLYGQSECPQCVTTLRKADHDPDRPDRLGSCGRPTLLSQIKLFDREMREVAPGEPGEICVRGPLVMSGYWNQPELTQAAFAGGWLHTGDVGIRDADGYLTIVDRTKDMIISGGFNIYPREVEDALASHPAVSLAAVIGVPDARWGEAVKAFVIMHPGASATAAELQAHVKKKRGAPWAPKSVEIVKDIPLTGLGKLDRKALRIPYWEGRDRAVS